MAIIKTGKRDPEKEKQAARTAKASQIKALHKGKLWQTAKDDLLLALFVNAGLVDPDTEKVI